MPPDFLKEREEYARPLMRGAGIANRGKAARDQSEAQKPKPRGKAARQQAAEICPEAVFAKCPHGALFAERNQYRSNYGKRI